MPVQIQYLDSCSIYVSVLCWVLTFSLTFVSFVFFGTTSWRTAWFIEPC